MSESKAETLSTSAAVSPTADSYALWSKLYDQACSLLATTQNKLEKENETDDKEITTLHQRIMITLDTITKLTFGLGATKKAQVVVHGNGTIELIVDLVRSSQVLADANSNTRTPLSKPIILSALKALKTCVLRNPAGRCRCRTAGVFPFLKDILNMIQGHDNTDTDKQDAEDKLLVEQLYTTLAAVCLGDDLNAFQASTQFKPLMEKTRALYCEQGNAHDSSLEQKIQYLERLFETVDEEQSDLVTYLSNKDDNEEFIQNINNAEKKIRIGYECLRDEKYDEAKDQYNSSLELISQYMEHTKLFHPLMIEIRTKRGHAFFGMDKHHDCLADTTYLLEQERLGESAPMTTITVLKMHSKALMKLGRNEEAKESLGKLSLLCPGDDEVSALMNNLKL